MCEYYYSFLVKDGFPNFVEFLNAEQVNDDLEITANVQLTNLKLGPAVAHILVEIFICSIDEFVIGEIFKENFDCA